MSIVENIKTLCKQQGTSIPKLEEELNFGNGAIYKWDTNAPGLDKVQKAAQRFGVSIEFLIQGHEHREPFTPETILKLAKENGSSIGTVITVLDQVKTTVLDESIVGSGGR